MNIEMRYVCWMGGPPLLVFVQSAVIVTFTANAHISFPPAGSLSAGKPDRHLPGAAQ